MVLELALLFCFPAAMCLAASMDFFTMTIPNRISFFLVILFLILAPILGMGFSEIGMHVLAGLAMLVVGFLMFSFNWIGGGDAKIFAVASLWLGFDHLFMYAVYASLLGGGLTLAIIFARKMPLPFIFVKQDWAVRLHDQEGGIPYGIALGLAALIIYPNSKWVEMTYM